MASDGQDPPGLLKRLRRIAGNLMYLLAFRLGWQPGEGTSDREGRRHVSGNGQFKPPGKVKLLFMFLGDQLVEILMALGWQPKEERGDGKDDGTR